MSKKRHVTTKTRNRRRKSYVQKHPRANSVTASPQEAKNKGLMVIMIIILIIAIVALLLSLIQGGGHTYDYYPGMPFWLSSK